MQEAVTIAWLAGFPASARSWTGFLSLFVSSQVVLDAAPPQARREVSFKRFCLCKRGPAECWTPFKAGPELYRRFRTVTCENDPSKKETRREEKINILGKEVPAVCSALWNWKWRPKPLAPPHWSARTLQCDTATWTISRDQNTHLKWIIQRESHK